MPISKILIVARVFVAHFFFVPLHAQEVVQGSAGATGSSPSTAASYAEECGEKHQRLQVEIDGNGIPSCGRAVKAMVVCLSNAMAPDRRSSCFASMENCGNGRDFIDCQSGTLQACGYQKVDGNSPLCHAVGAVRAYDTSTTEYGKQFGHVEFVCGVNKYCSVYKEGVLGAPWLDKHGIYPKSCWVPPNVTVTAGLAPAAQTPVVPARLRATPTGLTYTDESEREPGPLGKAAEVVGAIAAKKAAASLKKKPSPNLGVKHLGVREVVREDDSSTGDDSIFSVGDGSTVAPASVEKNRKPSSSQRPRKKKLKGK